MLIIKNEKGEIIKIHYNEHDAQGFWYIDQTTVIKKP